MGHTAAAVGGLKLPALESLGLGNLHPVAGVQTLERPLASWGVIHERSAGKDTTTGHWELAGLISERPFATFPDGFPPELMNAWQQATGVPGYLGNRPASGTQILEELGVEHLRTGKPIVYTSADSVFQIAAHEELIPLERLYELCRKARELVDPFRVARVIARPFVGDDPSSFARTYNRRDFSMVPPQPTVLDRLVAAGQEVIGVGKIEDIFAGRGLTQSHRTHGNDEGMHKLLELVRTMDRRGLVFVNLIDFDMLFGHRRNAVGYARALEECDRQFAPIIRELTGQDMLIITADHGCDPTFAATTDHTREQVPLLVYRPGRAGVPLGVRSSLADVAQTVAEALEIESLADGESFLGRTLTPAETVAA